MAVARLVINVRFREAANRISRLRPMTGSLKVFRCGPGCNFSSRRGVRPALTNLGRWKPRGLGVTYGERALAVEAVIAAGAVLVGLGAPVAVVFRHLVCGWFVDRPLRTQRRPSLWMMVANGLNRSANDDRSISKSGVKHRIIQPAPVVARVTLVSDRAGRSR